MLQAADIDVVERDQALPGLRLLLDEAALSSRLRESFPTIAPTVARPTYVRYKPATSALFGFVIDAAQPLHFHALATTRDGFEKLEKDAPPEAARNALGVAQLVWPDLHMVLRFFPYDRKLPSLALLNQPDRLRQLLEKIDPEQIPGAPPSMSVLAYKPERRYVARVEQDQIPRALLKICTTDAYERVVHNARMFRSQGTLRTAKLLGKSDWQHAVGLKFLGGRTFAQMLSDHASPPQEIVELIADALFTLHRAYPDHPRAVGSQERAESLAAVGDMIAWVLPQVNPLVQSLLKQLVKPVRAEAQSAIHGDFYAKQILIDSQSDPVGIVDFDEARLGDAWEDVANFIAHLESDTIRQRISSSSAQRVSPLLVDAYAHRAGHRSPQLKFYIATSLFRLAPHPFRRREPDWDRRTRQMLESCQMYLAGGPQIP
jgi:hypothetical protein